MIPRDLPILIVDDSPAHLELLKAAFEALKFTNISDAQDGRQALDLMNVMADVDDPIQLVCSDWSMPIMDGVELLRAVRASPKLSQTTFLLITSQAEKAKIIEAAQAGVNGYIMKPFTAETLQKSLEKLSGGRP